MTESDCAADDLTEFVRAVGQILAEAFERMRPAFMALAEAVHRAFESNLQLLGLFGSGPASRTTKAERRRAKRLLALRRRACPEQRHPGVAETARRCRQLADGGIVTAPTAPTAPILDPYAPCPLEIPRDYVAGADG